MIKKIIILSAILSIFTAFAGRGTDVFGETSGDNYKLYCAQCHGLKGNGSGVNKADMSVAPRNHTDTIEMSRLKDSDIYEAIAHGGTAVGKSTLMPPWHGVMTDAEIREMVAYLRELCHCKGE